MRTRLFLVLCLAWAMGCGNRDPGDVDLGFGPLQAATLQICNDRNCLGGANDKAPCADDADCPGGACEIFVPLRECAGGSVATNTRCDTDLECGTACVGGASDGKACLTDDQCQGICQGGNARPDGASCPTDAFCGGACLDGSLPDGQLCTSDTACGAKCAGGSKNGSVCLDDVQCPGGTCVPLGQCVPEGQCINRGQCLPGSCEQVGELCAEATELLNFEGSWVSCRDLTHFLSGQTNGASTQQGAPVEVSVSGCNAATLNLSFTPLNPANSDIGCVRVVFATGGFPDQEQCGNPIHMVIPLQ